ncbi:MAG: hypothetical protein ACR2HR_15440 [Euzebya sp.]
MGVLVGFAVGYYLGTRSGALSVEELVQSFNDIRKSEEFQALQGSASAMVSQVMSGAMDTRKESDNAALVRAVVEGGVTVLTRRLAA